ncbi:hypothetical protein KBB17_04370 [Candidatus Saccharibacteria bacterium]|jgi:hypothetical protein|nr:hypothetical protein [Candidatus Saccharibacteria bacterium]MBP9132289.1 hypothetical protein [Candidatus Saccharibacteria bacterium]
MPCGSGSRGHNGSKPGGYIREGAPVARCRSAPGSGLDGLDSGDYFFVINYLGRGLGGKKSGDYCQPPSPSRGKKN